ncbi:hypothetical protein DENSPDRAFT_887486, partial [Dentipellis sp. KUC8613]
MAPSTPAELTEDHEEWLRKYLADFRNAEDPKKKDDILKDVTTNFCKKFRLPQQGIKEWHAV